MNNLLQLGEYSAVVQYSGEDEVFYGKIIGINDLVSFEGTSITELKAAFEEAVEDYLETCRELQKEPNKMYKGSFNVRIDPDLHRKAAFCSAQNNMSLNEFIGYAVKFTLDANQPGTINVASGSLAPNYAITEQVFQNQASPFITCSNENKNVQISHTNT